MAAVGVEEVGAILVDGDAGGLGGEAVAGDVGAFFDEEAALAGVGKLAGKGCAEEAGTDDEEVKHGRSEKSDGGSQKEIRVKAAERRGWGGGGFGGGGDGGAAFGAFFAGGVGAEVVGTFGAKADAR